MTKLEIIKLLATTKSDEFNDAGKDEGMTNYAVIQALVDSGDRFLVLKALQVAYALGIGSAHRVLSKHNESAVWEIKDSIQKIRWAEADEAVARQER